ncbi:hypothetical protein NC651_035680 [Populus alba x Populus x berolinensis]|nr:hypothetical protein NC651_035680 [Populus alba x Populus x berolinensis]
MFICVREKAGNGGRISAWVEPVRYYPWPELKSASRKFGRLLLLLLLLITTRPPFMPPPCSPHLTLILTVLFLKFTLFFYRFLGRQSFKAKEKLPNKTFPVYLLTLLI